MKVELSAPWGAPPEDPKQLAEYVRHMVELLARLTQTLQLAVNGQLTFGDGTSKDNVAGSWVTFTTDGTADQAVDHNLGVTPVGFLVVVPPAYGVITVGASSWTSSQVFLGCGEASQDVTIFVLAPPRQLL